MADADNEGIKEAEMKELGTLRTGYMKELSMCKQSQIKATARSRFLVSTT